MKQDKTKITKKRENLLTTLVGCTTIVIYTTATIVFIQM